MKDCNMTVDCRGLPEAIVVLRIKQALQKQPKLSGYLVAQLARGCDSGEVSSALHADAARVRFVVEGAKPTSRAAPALAS